VAGFRWCSFCRLKLQPANQPHQSFNTQRNENKTTDVVIHQHSRKLLMMAILMSETCWAHNKLNKIASDIKLVFHSSTIAMMHGPINIRSSYLLAYLLTYCMKQSPSLEANRFSPSQAISRILWNPKVHYRIHKSPPPVPNTPNSS